MRLDLEWPSEHLALDLADGVVTVGGSPDDGIQLAGLPAALLTLTLEGPSMVVTARQTVKVGGVACPSHVPRLVLEGETVELPEGYRLHRPLERKTRQQVGTALVAKALLQGAPVPAAHSRAATLTCVTGVDVGTTYPLALAKTTIGRAAVDLRLRDRAVSRTHAQITRHGQDFIVESRASTNGLFVNGHAVRKARRLKTGDVLELGQTLLRFDGPEHVFDELTVSIAAEPVDAAEAAGPTLKLPTAGRPVSSEIDEPEAPLPSAEPWLIRAGVALAVLGLAATFAALR